MARMAARMPAPIALAKPRGAAAGGDGSANRQMGGRGKGAGDEVVQAAAAVGEQGDQQDQPGGRADGEIEDQGQDEGLQQVREDSRRPKAL